MTLQQLRYVVAVAEKGTISSAAESLYISQPSLTSAIKELEKEMEITIFYRTNKGVICTNEGTEFLGYARQVLEQVNLLETKYKNEQPQNPIFAVSCQHYSFAVNAFVDVIKAFDQTAYDFTLREEQTYEIIEDVRHLKSEIGILYLCDTNRKVLQKIIKNAGLKFEALYTAKPHVFISSSHPLADRKELTLADLEPYPYLSFEQGTHNSFYYSEELFSTIDRKKRIRVRDRATLFNLAIGLDGYTISSGVIDPDLNGEQIIAKPLREEEEMTIGMITLKDAILSRYGKIYKEALLKHINEDGQ
ncbi:LysR family transcriptional regulator [Catenisphaera adipataccumulans]|jgi:DNA-binding transcriptional LysR family regulator|uniref:DNA-binding transcriptional LysR family regulator n=1 Tax=Catenisphaera adipataccumulans TaxID=700500 RepID=A0A7W8CY83_9FIRM|nr:LysR family transcriptional regulator [Catenisphaera adipataccumulans]MBB5183825.1 DNA-binding transcriptional LysR family regulator [Catenisphaera adipataccumulans]